MPITASGVGSGLDIENIVTQLMSLERRPLVKLQQKEAQAQAQISDFGALKSAVSSFKDAMGKLATVDKFKVFSAASSNEGVLTASASSTAAGGSYNLTVQRLAQNHKLGSTAFASGTTFGGTAGDSLTLTVNGASSIIDLSTATTLAGVRDAINQAADNPGVTATIINDGTNEHLVLTANDSGYANRVQLSYGGTITASTFGFGTLNQDASGATLSNLSQLDAAFSVDGIAVTAASNKVTGVVDGLTLDLKGVGSSTLSVTRDTQAIQDSAQAFVDAYNAVLDKVDKYKSGDIGNDSLLRGIVSRMRAVLNSPASGATGSFTSLSELGITTNRDTGKLELDSTRFSAALNTDFGAVAQVFTESTTGYATRFTSMADSMLAADGVFKIRIDSLNARVKRYRDRESSIQSELVLKEKALRAKYGAMDALVGSLNATSQFLSARFFGSGNQ
jgi:flagellar hook-associated protein 2